MDTLFQEYEEVKPILQIGSYFIGKYQKKEVNSLDKVVQAIQNNPSILDRQKKKKGITNERQSIIKTFVDELNNERDVTKMKPLTAKYIAVKLGILKTNQELYEFLSECRDYKKRNGSFGKRFFGGFKDK